MALACPNCGTEHAPDALLQLVRRFPPTSLSVVRRRPAGLGGLLSACGAALDSSAARGRSSDREERKVVTVLLADLAGSTALGERLDPEDVRALQEDVFTAADGEIRRFGGVPEKFVGDAVMAVSASRTHTRTTPSVRSVRRSRCVTGLRGVPRSSRRGRGPS